MASKPRPVVNALSKDASSEGETTCPNCGEDLDMLMNFDNLGDEFECGVCHAAFVVEYDESWNEESGEESYWFWASKEL